MQKFLDLSEHNIIKDYNAFKDSNLSGVIIKATEGVTYKDSTFNTKYNNLVGKIPLGAYHMLCVTSTPEEQAREFYKTINGKKINIRPVVDVEYDNLKTLAEEYTKRFIEEFYRLSGITCIIYTGYYYYKDNFSKWFKDNNDWWIASYGVSKAPSVPNIVAWQYTETCKDYSFINGFVDCNYIIDEEKLHVEYTKDSYDDNIILRLQKELNNQCFKDKNGNRLVEDGIMGELTLSALPMLKLGSMGNITKIVQEIIGVESDGIFGEITEKAIINFQYKNNITCDGIVGKITWRKLLCY